MRQDSNSTLHSDLYQKDSINISRRRWLGLKYVHFTQGTCSPGAEQNAWKMAAGPEVNAIKLKTASYKQFQAGNLFWHPSDRSQNFKTRCIKIIGWMCIWGESFLANRYTAFWRPPAMVSLVSPHCYGYSWNYKNMFPYLAYFIDIYWPKFKILSKA